jgi:type I restriction enzyme M protein
MKINESESRTNSKSLTDLDNLPDPDILANEIIDNLESGLNSFREIMETINGNEEE